jgi:hypothetical protein
MVAASEPQRAIASRLAGMANQEWALDFAHDVIAAGRTIRVLSVTLTSEARTVQERLNSAGVDVGRSGAAESVGVSPQCPPVVRSP